MRVINNIVESTFPPANTNSMWVYQGVAKYFTNGKWQIVGDGEYVLPTATTTTLGGVKQGTAVADIAVEATTANIVTSVNSLLASLRSAGVLNV